MSNTIILYKGYAGKKVIDGHESEVFPFVGYKEGTLGIGLGHSGSNKLGHMWGLLNKDEQTLTDMWRAMKILQEVKYIVVNMAHSNRVNDLYASYETAKGLPHGSILAQLEVEKLDLIRSKKPTDLQDKIKALEECELAKAT